MDRQIKSLWPSNICWGNDLLPVGTKHVLNHAEGDCRTFWNEIVPQSITKIRLKTAYTFHSIHPGSNIPDSQVHGANMGPTWVLSAPDGPHVGPMYLAIRNVAEMGLLFYLWLSKASANETKWPEIFCKSLVIDQLPKLLSQWTRMIQNQSW